MPSTVAIATDHTEHPRQGQSLFRETAVLRDGRALRFAFEQRIELEDHKRQPRIPRTAPIQSTSSPTRPGARHRRIA